MATTVTVTGFLSRVTAVKRLSESPTYSGLNRKAVCGHKENTAAGFCEHWALHADRCLPSPPPDTTTHRTPPTFLMARWAVSA